MTEKICYIRHINNDARRGVYVSNYYTCDTVVYHVQAVKTKL